MKTSRILSRWLIAVSISAFLGVGSAHALASEDGDDDGDSEALKWKCGSQNGCQAGTRSKCTVHCVVGELCNCSTADPIIVHWRVGSSGLTPGLPLVPYSIP